MKGYFYKSIQAALLFLSVLAASAIIKQTASLAAEQVQVYLPLLARDPGLTITGQITDANGNPLENVQMSLSGAQSGTGKTILTDANGNYIFAGLKPDEYTLTPAKEGYVFSPATRQLSLPPESVGQNFLSKVKDGDLIENGTCEGEYGWEFPATARTAGYSNAQKYNGSRAIETGIVRASENRLSYSVAQQVFNVPSQAPQYVLSLWIYSISGEADTASTLELPAGPLDENTVLESDFQYVWVLNPDTGQTLERLYLERRNDKEWRYIEFDMRKYAGMQIELQIGTYNNGYGGVTAMYADDISFNIGPLPIGPTATPGAPVPTPICENILGNPGFESDSDWEIPQTAYLASYTKEQVKSGSRAMRTGIRTGANVYSYSDVRQKISIPKNSAATTLTLWLYARSAGAAASAQEAVSPAPDFPVQPLATDIQQVALSGDLQYVILLDENLKWIDTLVWQRSNASEWQFYRFDLRKYAGETLYLQVGAYNDGWGALTALYADEMSLGTCQGPTATPTATPDPAISATPTRTPTQTPTPTITPTTLPANCSNVIDDTSFEEENAWEIEDTAYRAAYSQEKVYYGGQSMRAGIVSAAHNQVSYSDFSQTIAIPSAGKVDLYFWQYPLSSEPTTQSFEAVSSMENWGQQVWSGDIQYVIAIDAAGNRLMLYQDRTNEAEWVLRHLDLKNYAGQTITLQFGVYNNGGGGVTAMYVDNAVLLVCP
ncbi:MAG: carboxypeptidase-like regulatory domain-containing protein [Chloroflexota bacterium]